jgi:type II secretory pathway pseudopilin PulG
LELLAVITLIALLVAALFAAAQHVVTAMKSQRRDLTARSLETAITKYRTDYGNWPIHPTVANAISNSSLRLGGVTNYWVFDLLRSSTNDTRNLYNTNNISYLDLSTLMSVNAAGRLTPRHLLPADATPNDGLVEAERPIVYAHPNGGIGYYSISFDFEADTVTITP